MMKLVSIVSIAGMAAAAEQGLPIGSISSSRPLEGVTTEDLERATRQFIEANSRKIRPKKNKHDGERGTGGKKQEQKRKLRSSSNRKGRRSGKGGKWWGGGGGGGVSHSSSKEFMRQDYDDQYDDDNWHGSGKSSKGGGGGGKWWGGGGGSAKSGKGSGRSGGGGGGWKSSHKSGGGWNGGGWNWPDEEVFYMLPTACPYECVSSHVTSMDEMKDSIKMCKDHEESQMWVIRSDGSYIMIESYEHPGMCIAVDYEHGDDEKIAAATCYNGELMLKDCHDTEYGTEWYFTGGQLVNTFCWGTGLSSMMTVFIDDTGKNGNKLIKQCEKDLAVWGAIDEAVLKADTFMFVNRLPEAPFFIRDVDDVLDGKVPKPDSKIALLEQAEIVLDEADGEK